MNKRTGMLQGNDLDTDCEHSCYLCDIVAEYGYVSPFESIYQVL